MNNKYAKELCHSQFQGSELYHHGILGMHWGVRRYQPYPKGYTGDGKFVGKTTGSKQQNVEEKLAKRKFGKIMKQEYSYFSAAAAEKRSKAFGRKPLDIQFSYDKAGTDDEKKKQLTDGFERGMEYSDKLEKNAKRIMADCKDAIVKEFYDDEDMNVWVNRGRSKPVSRREFADGIGVAGVTINVANSNSPYISVWYNDGPNGYYGDPSFEVVLDPRTLKPTGIAFQG